MPDTAVSGVAIRSGDENVSGAARAAVALAELEPPFSPTRLLGRDDAVVVLAVLDAGLTMK